MKSKVLAYLRIADGTVADGTAPLAAGTGNTCQGTRLFLHGSTQTMSVDCRLILRHPRSTYEFLTLSPVRAFLAGRRVAGVPARELAAVEGAAELGKPGVMGDVGSSTSS